MPPLTPRQIARDTQIAALSAAHLAALAQVPTLTDFPYTLNLAQNLARKVRSHAACDEFGMLGPDGIEPAVCACVREAKAHGFGWRNSAFAQAVAA